MRSHAELGNTVCLLCLPPPPPHTEEEEEDNRQNCTVVSYGKEINTKADEKGTTDICFF